MSLPDPTVWEALPPMRSSRMNFNPCMHRNRVFLCGFGAVETFDPVTRQYGPSIECGYVDCCCVYADRDTVVVVSNSYREAYTMKDDSALILQWKQENSTCSPMNQNTQPVYDPSSQALHRMWESTCRTTCLQSGSNVNRQWSSLT